MFKDYANAFGCEPYFDADGDNSVQTIKSTEGEIHAIVVHNPNATTAFIQFFDEAGTITVGTTDPKQSFPVPPPAETPAGGPLVLPLAKPMRFHNSIKYACTTTADGNTDPSVGLVVNVLYV
jgi:hypothetical protein